MGHQKTEEYYDKLYSEEGKTFRETPLPTVEKLTGFISGGSVLEIGAGAGANSLYLAGKGFAVTAVDISSKAIAILEKRAAEAGLSVTTKVGDIAELGIHENYDVIISAFTFHHLTKEEGYGLIKKMQEHTNPGGVNLLLVYTKNGEFYRNNPAMDRFYPDGKGEMETLYAGWTILSSFEKEGKARTEGNDGSPQLNVLAGLFAQKLQ